MYLFWFFIQWHINICGLFNTKAILVEEQPWYLTHCRWNKVVHIFTKGINLKGIIIVWGEYGVGELVY